MRLLVAVVGTTLALGLTFPTSAELHAQPTTTLEADTIEAFEGYVKPLEQEYLQSIEEGEPDFWMDDPQERTNARSGRILVRKIEDVPEIPGGIIHVWEGLVFVPEAKVEVVRDLLIDYDRHKEVYPEAIDSKLLSREGDTFRGYLRLKKTKVLTVVLNTEHQAEVINGNAGRIYLFSRSVRIAEVKNAGEPDEKELPVGEDSGFLWRLNAYWSLEQVTDGVLAGCTTVSLSRQIPWGLGWMIRPFVESTPRETLEQMLQATRVALHP